MTTKAKHLYEFDNCLLNVEQEVLLVDGDPIHLDPKELALLTYMARNPGRVLEKDELLKAVWGNTFIEEGRLTQVVNSLRPKIGRTFIETVRSRGYRFNAKVQDKSSIADEECPWVGLVSFDEKHAEYFFGRDQEVEDIANRLMKERFLAIIGSSGRGKSSVVSAGLVPLLRKAPDPAQAWTIGILRPTHSPLRQLSVSLLELTGALPDEEAIRHLMERLGTDPDTLTRHLTSMNAGSAGPVLLVIDQLEELFSPFVQARDRESFIANLLIMVSSQTNEFFVVVTVRIDFLQMLEAHHALWRLLSDHFHFVRRFSRENLRQSIEGPAAAVGLELDDNLADEILDDLGSAPGSLPLLSHTMAELFKLRTGVKLTFGAYRAIGKVRGAIAHHAESVFASFHPSDQAVTRRVLIKLTDVGLRTGTDVGRRVTLQDLVLESNEYQEVWRVVRTLSDKRLLTIGADHEILDCEGTQSIWVEFSHVALIQHWPRLAKWLNEKRHALRTFHSLDAEAKAWDNSGRDAEFLYAGHRLEHALKERANYEEFIEDIHSEFLAASEASVERGRHAEKQRLRRKRQIKWLTGGVSLLIFVLAFALWKWHDTKQQRDVADSLRRAADSISQLSVDPELSMLLAIESGHLTLTMQTEAALRQALAASRVRVVYLGHQAQIISIDLSRDGRSILTGGLDRSIRVWDVATGLTTKTIGDQSGGFYWAAFSPDGLTVVTASRDGAARLWDVNSGQLLRELRSHPAESQKKISVNHAIFSPDGTIVLTAEQDGIARIWDQRTGRIIRELKGHTAHLNTVAFSPNGLLIATASGDKTARLWESASGKEVASLKGHQESVLFVVFSPDGKRIATASRDRTVRIWNTESGAEELVLSGHSLQVNSAQFSPDGRLLVTSSHDGTARVWDSLTGNEVVELLGHGSAINTAIFSSDGQYVFTASGDHTARKWALDITQRISSLNGHIGPVFSIAFSPDGQKILTAGLDKTVRLWNTRSASQLKLLIHPTSVRRAVFSSDGKSVATIGDDQFARIWDTDTGKLKQELSDPSGRTHSIAFGPDGNKIATANADGATRIWDLRAGQIIREIKAHKGDVYYTIFNPNGHFIATAGKDNRVCVWDVMTGENKFESNIETGTVNAVTFSPDGQYLLASCRDRTARIWSLSDGKAIAVLRGHDQQVNSAEFSPNRALVITASDDHTMRLWEFGVGKTLLQLRSMNPIKHASFSPDGRLIATADDQGNVTVYSCDLCGATGKELLALAESRKTRDLTPGERTRFLTTR